MPVSGLSMAAVISWDRSGSSSRASSPDINRVGATGDLDEFYSAY
jgi:hypothetical protein